MAGVQGPAVAGRAGFASELRETGNRWAHGEAFTADDTYRALDTMERLLTAVGRADEADEVASCGWTRSRPRSRPRPGGRSGLWPASRALGLKPWREVILPHQDVASGNFRASEFAADLYYVSLGEGSREYVDPVEFFRRTYLTEGLKDLLLRRRGGSAGT